MRRSWFNTQSFLTIFAVAVAALALFVALRADRRVDLDTDGTLAAGSPEAILERANDAVNFTDTILSFLEGASVVIGAILAAGAFVVRNSLQRQMEENRAFFEETEQALAEREKALDALEETVQKRINDVVEKNRAEIETVQRQAREAISVLSKIVLAEQQIRAHNYCTALHMLEDAHRAEPDNYATNYLLGYLHIANKSLDEATEHLERALQAEPNFAPAIAALGLALRRKGDRLPADQEGQRRRLWAEAESRLLEALESDPRLIDADGESYYGTLGGLYRRQERIADAIDAYEHARRITPQSSYPVGNLAALFHRQNRDDEARAMFERVRQIAKRKLADDPRDNWARADAIQALLVLGREVEALVELDTLLESSPRVGTVEAFRDSLRFLQAGPRHIDGLETAIARLSTFLDAQEAKQEGDGQR